ncbi:MULE domain-containing protein [Trichonephila clavipes]|nr:MULE domain-containing protein [Trichonephila clavipes]
MLENSPTKMTYRLILSSPSHVIEFERVEFVTWKEEEEKKAMSKYVRQRGCETLQNGEIVMNFHCCRSGTYKSKGKGLRNLKSQGSAKIGISCPAVIKVRQSTENVVVHYFRKHQNHETQLEHLSESDRTAIADSLIRGNICKHIHKVVQMFLNDDTRNEEIQENLNQNDILKETFDVLPCSSKSANNDDHESKKRKIESILALITSVHQKKIIKFTGI